MNDFEIGQVYHGKDSRGVDYTCLCAVDLAMPEKRLILGIVLSSFIGHEVDINAAVKNLSTYSSNGLYDMTNLKNAAKVDIYDPAMVDKIKMLVNENGVKAIKDRRTFKKGAISAGYVYHLQNPDEYFINIRRLRAMSGNLNGGWLYDDNGNSNAIYLSHFELTMRQPKKIGYMKLWDYHVQRAVFTNIIRLNPHESSRPLPFSIEDCITPFD